MSPEPIVAVCEAPPPPCPLAEGGLIEKISVPSPRLGNSEIINDLRSFLSHLPASGRHDIVKLSESHPLLFSDHPLRTSVLHHDIEVEGHAPIKQLAYRVNPMKLRKSLWLSFL